MMHPLSDYFRASVVAIMAYLTILVVILMIILLLILSLVLSIKR